MQRQKNDANHQLLQYAGIGTQWLILMGLGAFGGYKLDQRLGWRFPVAVWLIPLVILVISLVRVARDTGKGK